MRAAAGHPGWFGKGQGPSPRLLAVTEPGAGGAAGRRPCSRPWIFPPLRSSRTWPPSAVLVLRPSSFWSCVWSAAVPPPSRPHSKYFRALWAPRSVLRPLSSFRRDSTWASGCRCVPATLRMWTLRSEFHTSFVCHRIFFFFQAFKSVKPILSSRAIWK